MNEELDQHISEFLDNELDYKSALNLLQKMQTNPDLKNTLNRYAVISHALKTDDFLPVAPDFSAKIAQQIQQEIVYLLPQRKPSAKRHYKSAALAASVAIIAVVASRDLNHSAPSMPPSTTVQLSQQTPAPKVDNPGALKPDPYPLNARISDYLQAHNNGIYTTGETDFRGLAKVTAYSQK